jgi:hypothetical protein
MLFFVGTEKAADQQEGNLNQRWSRHFLVQVVQARSLSLRSDDVQIIRKVSNPNFI